jgi:hypothetical protein
MTQWPDHPIDLWSSFEQGPESVAAYPVDGIGAAVVESSAEKQFSATISVGIDGVDEFHAGGDVEVMGIGLGEEKFL